MFLFIYIVFSSGAAGRHSNTSYVLIYLYISRGDDMSFVFKYILCSYLSRIQRRFLFLVALFKYILCSYLSLPFVPFHNPHLDSNTSYVLIYQMKQKRTETGKVLFKYILCSYLSYPGICRTAAGTGFKYILCSYLSPDGWKTFKIYPGIQIHPMFLFIFEVFSYAFFKAIIQIHPMFLFIYYDMLASCSRYKFKYILCSYLSGSFSGDSSKNSDSNTSYVLIYPWTANSVVCKSNIQIHPMFYLIPHLIDI